MSQDTELIEKVIRLCATGLVSVISTSALGYIRSMAKSIATLELSVARVLERSVFLEKTLDLLSTRLERLENKHKIRREE